MAVPYENWVGGVLQRALAPLSAEEIRLCVNTRHRHNIAANTISAFLSMNAGAFRVVPSSNPARWYVVTSPAGKDIINRQPGPGQKKPANGPPPKLSYDISDLPPLEVAADREFDKMTVVVGGGGSSLEAVEAAVGLLRARGAAVVRALSGQKAGSLACQLPRVAPVAYPSDRLRWRRGVARAHLEALRGAGALCIIGGAKKMPATVVALIAAAEGLGLPCYLAGR